MESTYDRPQKFLNKNYLLLYQAQSISRLGNSTFMMAMNLWIIKNTGSASLMGLLVMFSNLPGFFLGPVAGIFADRTSRKSIILLSDILRGLALLGLSALLLLRPDSQNLILVAMFFTSVFVSVVTSFFSPAIQASIPELVPMKNIHSANSLGQISVTISALLGSGLGGVLFRFLGAQVLFLINALGYMYAAATESFVKIPQPTLKPIQKSSKELFADFVLDFKEGLRYVWHKPGLREMVFVQAFLTLFTAPVLILMPIFVLKFMKVSEDWVGYMSALYAAGTMAGFVFSGIVSFKPTHQARVLIGFIIGEAMGYGFLGLVRMPLMALGFAFFGGFAGGYVTVNVMTILQRTTPSEIRGRVFGLLSAVAVSLSPISSGLSGVIADMLNQNIPLIYVTCGVIMTGLTLLLALNKEFRLFMSEQTDQPVQEIVEQPASSAW